MKSFFEESWTVTFVCLASRHQSRMYHIYGSLIILSKRVKCPTQIAPSRRLQLLQQKITSI